MTKNKKKQWKNRQLNTKLKTEHHKLQKTRVDLMCYGRVQRSCWRFYACQICSNFFSFWDIRQRLQFYLHVLLGTSIMFDHISNLINGNTFWNHSLRNIQVKFGNIWLNSFHGEEFRKVYKEWMYKKDNSQVIVSSIYLLGQVSEIKKNIFDILLQVCHWCLKPLVGNMELWLVLVLSQKPLLLLNSKVCNLNHVNHALSFSTYN